MTLLDAIDDLREAVAAFAPVDLGHPKGANAVHGHVRGDGDAVELRRRLRELELASLEAFHLASGGISLPDVGVGLFVHTALQVLRELRRGAPVRLFSSDGPAVFPFGSDGGGSLFVMPMDGSVIRLPSGPIAEGVHGRSLAGSAEVVGRASHGRLFVSAVTPISASQGCSPREKTTAGSAV